MSQAEGNKVLFVPVWRCIPDWLLCFLMRLMFAQSDIPKLMLVQPGQVTPLSCHGNHVRYGSKPSLPLLFGAEIGGFVKCKYAHVMPFRDQVKLFHSNT